MLIIPNYQPTENSLICFRNLLWGSTGGCDWDMFGDELPSGTKIKQLNFFSIFFFLKYKQGSTLLVNTHQLIPFMDRKEEKKIHIE